jgi:N-acyl-L-homoserine lactone synthetase
MLKLIEGSYASFFPKEIDAMFRNRAETFSDRLGWKEVVKDGYERDLFDDANPLYLVSVDPDTEEYWGSLRLLPTTGPNMLRDVFPHLLDGEYIESATIWESSRICTAAARSHPERSKNTASCSFGYRRSRGCGGPDANRQRVRRQDVPRLESRRIQSSGHRNPSTNRGRDVLRRSFRH